MSPDYAVGPEILITRCPYKLTFVSSQDLWTVCSGSSLKIHIVRALVLAQSQRSNLNTVTWHHCEAQDELGGRRPRIPVGRLLG